MKKEILNEILELKDNEEYGINVGEKYHIFIQREGDLLFIEPNIKEFDNEGAEPCGEPIMTTIGNKKEIEDIIACMEKDLLSGFYKV